MKLVSVCEHYLLLKVNCSIEKTFPITPSDLKTRKLLNHVFSEMGRFCFQHLAHTSWYVSVNTVRKCRLQYKNILISIRTLRKTCRDRLRRFNIIAWIQLKTMEAPMYWSNYVWSRQCIIKFNSFHFHFEQKQQSHFSLKILVNHTYLSLRGNNVQSQILEH